MRSLAVLVILLSAPLEASAASPKEWKQVSDRDGIKVWVQEVPGDVSNVRASGIIDAPPERVLAVLADVANYKDTMPHTKESKLLKREGNEIWMYSLISPPLGADRDYCVKITLFEEEDGVLGTHWVPANEACPPPKEGTVRVKTNDGSWSLTPLDGGKRTGAVYFLHVDPGGKVPKWIIDRTNRSSVPDAFKAVRKAATSKRYADAPSPLEGGEAPSGEAQSGSSGTPAEDSEGREGEGGTDGAEVPEDGEEPKPEAPERGERQRPAPPR